eukprot:SAG31_NODE_15600_length_747_cov_1.236111_1_plen_101_part_00
MRKNALCQLSLGKGLTLTQGNLTTEFPHLSGRAATYSAASPVAGRMGGSASNTNECKLEWVVHAVEDNSDNITATIDVVLDFQRAGKLKFSVFVGNHGKL